MQSPKRKEDDKVYHKLKTTLKNHLQSFEKLTNWAEMADWLQKLAGYIETYDTQFLPCKKAMAKRLNQCLNIPGLPIGIHRTNMTIYKLIFEILKQRKPALVKNIAIFSYGLFSMFKRATLEIKQKILELFTNYYLPLNEQLVPMLPGLIGCLLSGMNDSETDMKSRILKLLGKINAKIGDHMFMSTLWQVLLKNSETRLQTIKALVYKMEKSKEKFKKAKAQAYPKGEERLDPNSNNTIGKKTGLGGIDYEEDESINKPQKTSIPNLKTVGEEKVSLKELKKDKESFQKMVKMFKEGNQDRILRDFFPNSVLIVNAICKSLGSSNVHVVKAILDFLKAYVSFSKNQILFTEPQMVLIFISLLRVLKEYDTSVRIRVYQLMFGSKELGNINLNSPNSLYTLDMMNQAYKHYLCKTVLDESEINLVFDIIDLFNQQRTEIALYILSTNAYNFVQFVYVLGYETMNAYTTHICTRLKLFIEASSSYIEKIIESLAAVIHENSQNIATELSRSKYNKKGPTKVKQIEKMFIIEFVVKIIINESDISIAKKREYMLLMLRSLLSMFNLFQVGVVSTEKKNFEKLLDMISQLLLLLKTQFSAEIDQFLKYWKENGLLTESNKHFQLSELARDTLSKMGNSEGNLDFEERSKFCTSIKNLIKNSETNHPEPLKTRIVCESDSGLLNKDIGRRSIINIQGSEIEQGLLKEILKKQFISQEVFDNETKVVMNLVIGSKNSSILVDNFKKLFFMLMKMEEFTLQGVLMNFRMRNVMGTEKKQPKIPNKNRKRNKITRFTSLCIPKDLKKELMSYNTNVKRRSTINKSNIIPRNIQPPEEKFGNQYSTNPSPEIFMESGIKLDDVPTMPAPTNLVFNKQSEPDLGGMFDEFGFEVDLLPNWLTGCLTIGSQSQNDPLVFYSLEFLYMLLDWDDVLSYSLAVRYNNFLYRQKHHFTENGIFTMLLKRIFDLMEVNAYKKIALNYFLSFVLENCDFVVKFVKKKLRSETARDFRQIASLWKLTSHIKSSKVKLCLQETVFDMLNYSDKEDPLIRNYFRNWLQYSENNFILIVDNLLKKLYLHTNMQVQNGRIVYNYLYNTRTFDRLLKLLKSVFVYGGNLFLHFVRKFSISPEFETFNAEIDAILGGIFSNSSKKYYVFIVKMLLIYLLADPNKDLYSDRNNLTFDNLNMENLQNISALSLNASKKKRQALQDQEARVFADQSLSQIATEKSRQAHNYISAGDHEKLTDCTKESICLFIEKLFTSLNSEEDWAVTELVQQMIGPVSFNLGKAIESNKITLQLEYLNLLSFFVFKTKFSEALGTLSIDDRRLTKESLFNVYGFGQNFLIIEDEESQTRNVLSELDQIDKSKDKSAKKKKSKNNKKKKSKKDKNEEAEMIATMTRGHELLEGLKKILLDRKFLNKILKGLNNEHTFVMTKYIEYLNKIIFLYTKLFENQNLRMVLKDIIGAYLNVIHENGGSRGALKDQEKRKEKVISLLKGLRFLLEEVLHVSQIEVKEGRNVEKALVAIFTFGIVSSKDSSRKKMIFKLEEETCMALINTFPELFKKLLSTYRLSNIISDADIYRMLCDPSSLKAGPTSNNQSVSGPGLPDSDSVMGYRSALDKSMLNISINDSVLPNTGGLNVQSQSFGIFHQTTRIKPESLRGISKYVFKILYPLQNNFVMKSIEAVLWNWSQYNKNSGGPSSMGFKELCMGRSNINSQTTHDTNDFSPMKKYSSRQEHLNEGKDLNNTHLKILETLLYADICPNRLIMGVLYSRQMMKIKEARKAFSSSKNSKKLFFWAPHAQKEVDLLSFVFGYIKYCCSQKNFVNLEEGKLDTPRLWEFSSSVLSLLKFFEGVENINTMMWTIDLISVLLSKFQGVGIVSGKNKNDWRSYVSDLWTKAGKILNDDFKFEFDDVGEEILSRRGSKKARKNSKKHNETTKPMKVGDQKEKILRPLTPISPSLRAASKNVMFRLAKHFRGEEEEKDKMFDVKKYPSRQTNVIRYKYFLLITLQKSLYQMCEVFLTSSKSSSSSASLNNSESKNGSEIMKSGISLNASSVWNIARVRPLIDKLLDILKVRKANSLIIQEVSQIVLILSCNKSFLNEFRQDLLDIFDGDEFFKCDVKTLKMWSFIIDRVLDSSKNSTVVDFYIKNIDFKGVFVFKSTENRKRMKCFLRICFIIFAGDTGKYMDKKNLKMLLEKIKNLLKEENDEPQLTILILFSLRILIMRLQRNVLNELFKAIWPSIIFLLRKLIKSKTGRHEGIFLASMKLLELISSTDIEEFNLHKWSFMFEYYGVKLAFPDEKSGTKKFGDNGGYRPQNRVIEGPEGDELIGFHVNPFLMAQMPTNINIFYDLENEAADKHNQKSINQKQNEGVFRRRVIITENSLEDIKLEHKIYEFLMYVVQSSTMDVQIDKEDLECVIERDFIDFGAHLLS